MPALKRSRDDEVPDSGTVKYWLMKSEPEAFSLDDLKRLGTSPWDGVRNYSARNNMQAMNVGDRVLFYHSNAKPSGIAGLATVCRTAYTDFTAVDPKSKYYDARTVTSGKNPWAMVDVAYDRPLERYLPLDELKKDTNISTMMLFTHGRLSVQPVEARHFHYILKLACRK